VSSTDEVLGTRRVADDGVGSAPVDQHVRYFENPVQRPPPLVVRNDSRGRRLVPERGFDQVADRGQVGRLAIGQCSQFVDSAFKRLSRTTPLAAIITGAVLGVLTLAAAVPAG
jgi:hypothetical protein